MFILYGDRRINFLLVKEYKAVSETKIGKTYHKIKLTFLDGSVDFFHFFDKKDERDEYLKKLDEDVRIQSKSN